MTIESATYPPQLNTAWPLASDIVSEGAGHLTTIKTVVKTTFPNVSGAMNASHTELNYSVGVTSGIQAQINAKGAIAGQTWTGTHNFSGGSITVPTMGAADNSTNAASTAFVQSKAFATALPNQTGNAGKFVTTDGSVASWSSTINGDLNFGGTGRRITGDFSNATLTSRASFQTSVANGASVPLLLPNGTGTISGITAVGASDPANAPYASMYFSGVNAVYEAGAYGTATNPNMVFNVGGAERLRIAANGNVLVTGSGGLGYGVGSGGTVTQATSKSTAVTLNKPSGMITLNASSMSAGVTEIFQFNNSSIVGPCGLVLNLVAGSGTLQSYNAWASVGNGYAIIYFKNISAGALAEAVGLYFEVINGATS